MRTRKTPLLGALVVLAAVVAATAHGATSTGSLTFSNTALVRPEGASEPAISISSNGTMAMTGLQWLFDPNFFGTHLWTGPFGSTPTFRGLVDGDLQRPAKQVFGSGDADVDIGSTGTLHETSLIFGINKPFNAAQLGVAAISCPGVTAGGFSTAGCTKKIIDNAGADRPWITSEGSHVYIAYHDAGKSAQIHVQRSDDDGITWQAAANPVVGQGGATANSTFNNIAGPIVADPDTHNVYTVYASGETGFLKGRTFTPNHIYVSRSSDGGKSWTANLVYTAPRGSVLANLFPALAVDPTNGNLYATWSDGKTVWFSYSTDQGAQWSPAVPVNIAPAATAIFPWVAAQSGTVDVVYYGTTAASIDDPAAVWNTYLAQTTNSGTSFAQSLVSNSSNHTGIVCTEGSACDPATRTLLDLFEVAIDPQNGKAAVIYTDDAHTTDADGNPLPQVVLAQQN
jgi:hypothetical protein